MTCRHKRTWIVFYGRGEWCYECGALRMMQGAEGTANGISPLTKWAKPAGEGGENPYGAWNVKHRKCGTCRHVSVKCKGCGRTKKHFELAV